MLEKTAEMWSTFDMRFSIVCYLDSESTDSVRFIQEELGKLTGARASLDLWKPHITVGDGIEIEKNQLPELKKLFEDTTSSIKPFDIYMHGILKIDSRKGGEGEVTTPYGLYLNVEKNEALINLVENISKATEGKNKWYLMPSPYHPHCTLAFKDLGKEGFEIGAKYLDDTSLALKAKVDQVTLVEMLSSETREFVRFNFAKKF